MVEKNKERIAIYPGSFDPITLGHMDILRDGAEMFDRVIIAIAKNPEKKSLLSIEERKKLINDCIKGLKNVEADSFSGLTIDYAKQKGATVLLRGLRAVSDFEYEMQLSQNNRALSDDIKTVFLMTRPEYSFISSSSVKEILHNKGDISKFVPEPVCKYLNSKF